MGGCCPNLFLCMTFAWFKRISWNHVFCAIVLYTNPSRAGRVFTHLRRAAFLSFDIKTIAKMRQQPRHVGNISSDIPCMLRFLAHFCNGFYIKQQKHGARKMREIHPALHGFVILYIAQWDKIHDSKTCV